MFFTTRGRRAVNISRMNDTSRADMHVHSCASQVSKVGGVHGVTRTIRQIREREEMGVDLLADAFLTARGRDPGCTSCSPAAARGGAHEATGLLAPADPGALGDAVLSLAPAPLLRERLARAAFAAVRDRTWEASLDRLAAGYRLVLQAGGQARARSVA